MTIDEAVLRERRRAHRLARRIIRFLKEEFNWSIRFTDLKDERVLRRLGFEKREIVGLTDWEEETLLIDPSYDDFFGVLIHECLHAIYPDAEEEEVLARERIVRVHLTNDQAADLLMWTARRLV